MYVERMDERDQKRHPRQSDEGQSEISHAAFAFALLGGPLGKYGHAPYTPNSHDPRAVPECPGAHQERIPGARDGEADAGGAGGTASGVGWGLTAETQRAQREGWRRSTYGRPTRHHRRRRRRAPTSA